MKKPFIILCIVTVLFSCNQEEKERAKLEEIKITKVEDIKLKNKIEHTLDDLFFRFSYQYNEVIESDRLLVDEFEVYDIYQKGGNTFVSIDTGGFWYLDLLIEDKYILQKLLNTENFNAENNVLIIKLEKLRKTPFVVGVYDDSYGDEIEFITEISRNDYSFIGTGKLLKLIKL